MINWFDMPAEGLSNGGMFEIKKLTATENKVYQKDGEVYNKVTVNVPSPTGKITITENGTDINVAQYATADVNVEGGGGSSDFSTAEVTVLNNTEELIEGIYVSVVDTPISTVRPMNTLSFNSSRTYIVPLYKGSCYWVFGGTANVSVSGNIEWDSENRTAFITGDCTITIS